MKMMTTKDNVDGHDDDDDADDDCGDETDTGYDEQVGEDDDNCHVEDERESVRMDGRTDALYCR